MIHHIFWHSAIFKGYRRSKMLIIHISLLGGYLLLCEQMRYVLLWSCARCSSPPHLMSCFYVYRITTIITYINIMISMLTSLHKGLFYLNEWKKVDKNVYKYWFKKKVSDRNWSKSHVTCNTCERVMNLQWNYEDQLFLFNLL